MLTTCMPSRRVPTQTGGLKQCPTLSRFVTPKKYGLKILNERSKLLPSPCSRTKTNLLRLTSPARALDAMTRSIIANGLFSSPVHCGLTKHKWRRFWPTLMKSELTVLTATKLLISLAAVTLRIQIGPKTNRAAGQRFACG